MYLRRILFAGIVVAGLSGGVTAAISFAAKAAVPAGGCTVRVASNNGRPAYQFNTPTMADASAAATSLSGQSYLIDCAKSTRLAAG